MINTQIKFEGKIHYGLNVVALRMNNTKFLSFMVNLTLNVKVKVTIFLNSSEIFSREPSTPIFPIFPINFIGIL